MKLHQNEDINTEFKIRYTDSIRKEIIAFANSQGGTIYIGVEDDGGVVGLVEADKVLLQVTNMLRDAIKPDVSMFTQCSVKTVNRKKIVVITVQRGTDRPYYIVEKGMKPSGVYVRLGSTSVPASSDAIRFMIKETDGDSFETMCSLNQELTFSDVSQEFNKRGLELKKSHMKNLGIIGANGLYTNLGLLLSDQCSHTIKIAVFQGDDKTEFKDRREFSGSLLKQLSSVYDYLDLYNKIHAEIKGLLRVDTRDYPEMAIRETLLNAIVHRDYSFSGSTLISIFGNRIEVVTLGGLVQGLSLEAIKMGASQSRNERLADVFYRLKLIEAYGTGITKVMNCYADHQLQPDFRTSEGVFVVVLPNFNTQKAGTIIETVEVKARKILEYISKHHDTSRRDLETLLGIAQTTVGNILRKLEREGSIKRVGNGKHTRYRLS